MIAELEAKRRTALRQVEKLTAPLQALALAQEEIAAIEAQIEEARAADEAERRAEQARLNEIAGLQKEWAQLQDIGIWPAKGMTVERWLWRVWQVADGLGNLGIVVEPFTVDPLAVAGGLVAQHQREQEITRTILTKDRATPEQEATYHQRHALTNQLLAEGLGHDQAEAITDLMIDEGLTVEEARQRLLGAEEDDHDTA